MVKKDINKHIAESKGKPPVPHAPYDHDDNDRTPEGRLLRRIVADPARARAQIAADKRLIAAISARELDLREICAALDAGANPDRLVHGGYSVLQVAVLRRSAAAVGLLLKYDASVNDVNARGATALDEAYRTNDRAIIDVLLAHDAKTSVAADHGQDMVYEYDSYQIRIDRELARALLQGTVREVADALALGANPDHVAPESRYDYSLFHTGVYLCLFDKTQKMIAAGADIHARSVHGETALDMLWWAEESTLLSPQWYALHDHLVAMGCGDMFHKRPTDMTPDDLRRQAPLMGHGSDAHGAGATSLMHRLVDRGQGAFVLDILKNYPQQALTAADLMKTSDYYRGETLLDAFARMKLLDRLFTSDVWQGRLDEMMSLRAVVDKNPLYRQQVDFESARAGVLARQIDDLRRMAASKPHLRLRPK